MLCNLMTSAPCIAICHSVGHAQAIRVIVGSARFVPIAIIKLADRMLGLHECSQCPANARFGLASCRHAEHISICSFLLGSNESSGRVVKILQLDSQASWGANGKRRGAIQAANAVQSCGGVREQYKQCMNRRPYLACWTGPGLPGYQPYDATCNVAAALGCIHVCQHMHLHQLD